MRFGMTVVLALASVLGAGSADAQTRYFAREMLSGSFSKPASPKCSGLTDSMLSQTIWANLGSAPTLPGAQAVCDAARVVRGPGSCTWIKAPGYSNTYSVFWSGDQSVVPYSTGFFAAVCT